MKFFNYVGQVAEKAAHCTSILLPVMLTDNAFGNLGPILAS